MQGLGLKHQNQGKMLPEDNRKHKKKIDVESQLRKAYGWLEAAFKASVEAAYADFWEGNSKLKLVSVSTDYNIVYDKEAYFVSKVMINKEQAVFLRLSKEAVQILLEETLGAGEKPFDLGELSEVEQKIILAFNDFLYKRIQKSLQIPETKEERKKLKNIGECNLIFFIKDIYERMGKIIITLPFAIINPITPEPNPENLNYDIDDFKKSKTLVNIEVGTSKLDIKDLKLLEQDDIIVLDKSNTRQMTLKLDETSLFPFKVNPNPGIILGLDEDGSSNMEHETMEIKDVWDSIQVEISAEFEKVKISLGELKQISEGLVVDIGSVYDNRVNLKVENRVIAKGELVIINDRYGVKVDEIYKEAKANASTNAEHQVQEEVEPQIPVTEEAQDDFDYSDFDIEDDNL